MDYAYDSFNRVNKTVSKLPEIICQKTAKSIRRSGFLLFFEKKNGEGRVLFYKGVSKAYEMLGSVWICSTIYMKNRKILKKLEFFLNFIDEYDIIWQKE